MLWEGPKMKNSKSTKADRANLFSSLTQLIVFLLISGLLSSCAMISGHTTPSYFEFQKKDLRENSSAEDSYTGILCPNLTKENNPLDKRVCDARAYAFFKIDKYKGAYKELKITNTFLFDLPLIGLAADLPPYNRSIS